MGSTWTEEKLKEKPEELNSKQNPSLERSRTGAETEIVHVPLDSI